MSEGYTTKQLNSASSCKNSRRDRIIFFDEEDIQTLVKLGLNGSQAKIYLTLSSLGVANAKQIAQTADIDHGEVYRQLEVLHKRGLVEKILNIPTEYKPMPLNKAIGMLIQQKNKENAEMKQKAKTLLKKGVHADMLIEDENRISIIPKDDYRKLYSAREIDCAKKEIIWYTQIERIPIALTCYYEAHKKAAARGVHQRVIAELNKPTDKILGFIQEYKKENPNFAIRFANPTVLVSFALFDDKEMNFSTQKLIGLANSQMLSTNDEQLIKVIKDYFELRWNAAMIEYPK